jgi:hypothetical protein
MIDDARNHERKVSISWNQKVRTAWIIHNNKLDIMIRDNNQEACMLLDVAVPRDRNVIKKEAEKI